MDMWLDGLLTSDALWEFFERVNPFKKFYGSLDRSLLIEPEEVAGSLTITTAKTLDDNQGEANSSADSSEGESLGSDEEADEEAVVAC